MVSQEVPWQPWNADARIELKDDELILFDRYIDVVAPI